MSVRPIALPTRRIVTGGAAVLMAVGALSGCSPSSEKDAPATSTTTTTSSSASTVSPTEKAVGPGDNSFSPTVNPAPPGAVCKEVVNGVCVR